MKKLIHLLPILALLCTSAAFARSPRGTAAAPHHPRAHRAGVTHRARRKTHAKKHAARKARRTAVASGTSEAGAVTPELTEVTGS